MKQIFILFLSLLTGMLCYGKDMERDFEDLVLLSGQKNLSLRQDVLKEPELKEFLQKKLQNEGISPLHKAEAHILLEWIEKKENIRNIMNCQVIDFEVKALKQLEKQPTVDNDGDLVLAPPAHNVPCGGFRYPRWFSLSEDKLDKLMKVYNDNPCPYFILECLWKFSGTENLELVTKPFKDVPKYTHHNPEYIYFGMAKTLSDEQKESFANVLESKIRRAIKDNIKPEAVLPDVERLVYLGTQRSLPTIIEWILKQEGNAKMLYLCQFIPIIARKQNTSELQGFKKIFDDKSSPGFLDFYSSFLDYLNSDKSLPNEWIKKYLHLVNAYPLPFYKDFIFRVRPDLEGKIIEVREGGSKYAVLEEDLDPSKK